MRLFQHTNKLRLTADRGSVKCLCCCIKVSNFESNYGAEVKKSIIFIQIYLITPICKTFTHIFCGKYRKVCICWKLYVILYSPNALYKQTAQCVCEGIVRKGVSGNVSPARNCDLNFCGWNSGIERVKISCRRHVQKAAATHCVHGELSVLNSCLRKCVETRAAYERKFLEDHERLCGEKQSWCQSITETTSLLLAIRERTRLSVKVRVCPPACAPEWSHTWRILHCEFMWDSKQI